MIPKMRSKKMHFQEIKPIGIKIDTFFAID